MFHRCRQRHGVTASVTLDTLRLAGGAGGIKDVRGIGRLDPGYRHFGIHELRTQRRVVDVAAFNLVETLVQTTIDHQHLGRLFLSQVDRLVKQVLIGNGFAATHAGIGRNNQLRRAIVDTGGQRAGSKAAEHDRVDGADPRTGEHRESRFGNHRHVDQHAVALADAEALHDRSAAHHFLLQLGEGINDFLVGLGGNEHQRAVVRALGGMTIDGVVAQVGFATDKPLGERRI